MHILIILRAICEFSVEKYRLTPVLLPSTGAANISGWSNKATPNLGNGTRRSFGINTTPTLYTRPRIMKIISGKLISALFDLSITHVLIYGFESIPTISNTTNNKRPWNIPVNSQMVESKYSSNLEKPNSHSISTYCLPVHFKIPEKMNRRTESKPH